MIHNSVSTTSPADLLEAATGLLLECFRNHLSHKIQLRLVCKVICVDATTGDTLDEAQPVFTSMEEIFTWATDVRSSYQRMVTKILVSFTEY